MDLIYWLNKKHKKMFKQEQLNETDILDVLIINVMNIYYNIVC